MDVTYIEIPGYAPIAEPDFTNRATAARAYIDEMSERYPKDELVQVLAKTAMTIIKLDQFISFLGPVEAGKIEEMLRQAIPKRYVDDVLTLMRIGRPDWFSAS